MARASVAVPPRRPREPPADRFAAIEVNLDVGAPAEFLTSADADIADRAATDSSGIPTLRDYFALVGAGMQVAALANSDTHSRDGSTGFPRTILRVGLDDPSAVTVDDIEQAIRTGRARGTSGPFVLLRVAGEARSGWQELVRAAGPVLLEIEVQAAPWVAVDTIELYENGRATRPMSRWPAAPSPSIRSTAAGPSATPTPCTSTSTAGAGRPER